MLSFLGTQQSHPSIAACKAPLGLTKVFSQELQSGVRHGEGELGGALLTAATLQEGFEAGQPIGSEVGDDDMLNLLQRDKTLQAGHCRAKTSKHLMGSRDFSITKMVLMLCWQRAML